MEASAAERQRADEAGVEEAEASLAATKARLAQSEQDFASKTLLVKECDAAVVLCVRMCVYVYVCVCVCMRMCTCMDMCMRMYVLARPVGSGATLAARTRTHAHARAHAHSHTRTHARAGALASGGDRSTKGHR